MSQRQALRKVVRSVYAPNYADNLVLAAEDVEQLQGLVNVVADYAARAGLRLNPGKSRYWLHRKNSETLPATIDVQDVQLILLENVEVLGAHRWLRTTACR